MEKLDFSPFKQQMDHMALQVAIILFIPIIVGVLTKLILIKLKVTDYFSNLVALIIFLYVFYRTLTFILS